MPRLTSLALLAAARVVQSVGFHDAATNSTTCSLDQTNPPGDLTLCGNATLFQVFRPKARFIAPEGWMNDPMALFQRDDGSFHAGYQYHPQHIQWGNISQGAAHSTDFVHWEDFEGPNGDPRTIWPSELYDIRGVFDGSIIANGWQGLPTIIYTSTAPGPLGATANPPEVPGSETQSIAFTADGGASWTKLRFGAGGNPVIFDWPQPSLTGFRDPYAFESSRMSALLANSTTITGATGDHFLTISGGIRHDVDPNGGGRLFLYRQTATGDVTRWTFLGALLSTDFQASWSEWSGNFGINFETASVVRLNEDGAATDDGSDPDAVDIIGFGTEAGRNGSHQDHWPLWSAVSLAARDNGSINANVLYSGVADWGRAYAFTSFHVSPNRQVSVGWTYDDDGQVLLAKQQGYQGAFTLFRDLSISVMRGVDPATPGLFDRASWGVTNETDGTVTVRTLAQRVVPEITSAYRDASTVSQMPDGAIQSGMFSPLGTQPTGRFYALHATFEFAGQSGGLVPAGFRVLASDMEVGHVYPNITIQILTLSHHTDIMYDPNAEELTVNRTSSSLITLYGNDPEVAKLKLFNIIGADGTSTRQTLNMSVYVDNSVVEIYANDVTVITTRVYPWLETSIGAGFISGTGGSNATVSVRSVELWDGLLDAWPSRPKNSSIGLVWDGPANALYGLWVGN